MEQLIADVVVASVVCRQNAEPGTGEYIFGA